MFTIKTRNQLYFARCLSGVGEGVFQCLVPYLLNQIYGEERGNKKLGVLFMAINLGISIGLLLGGVIPNRHYLYSAISFIEFLLLISLIYYRNTPIKKESQSITEYQKFKLRINYYLS